MIIGSPAKAVRELTEAQKQGLLASARHYVANAHRFRSGLKKIA
jgi:carbonic anhydrase/acetyltransferase-like protein (isoleucine patch superfamily)